MNGYQGTHWSGETAPHTDYEGKHRAGTASGSSGQQGGGNSK